jgi:diguanylate cyclase (GGDEF)-like protein
MLKTTTTRGRYAGLGAFLALGAPLGLLALRAARAREISDAWLADEVSCDAATYLYVAVSTMLAFSLFGFALGRQADRLRDLSRTDPLTALLNRRALQDRFEEEFARAARHRLSLSVLLVDVDGLKELNDREGHREGDAALQETAAALRRGSRITDVCARWGGDEFVVLAPDTDRGEALHLAERVRLTAGLNRSEGLTVSIGVATRDPARPHSSADALMSDADGALYEAKRLGRNRVVAR